MIGDPIAQSKSPLIHTAAYHYLSLENKWQYTQRRVSTEMLPQFIDEIRGDKEFRGCSVTMPLKKAVIPYLDKIDKFAKITDAVNCIIRRRNGKLIGYNTDVYGIEMSLRYSGKFKYLDGMFDNNSALILGSGATARSSYMALKLLSFKTKYIKIASRRPPEWGIEFPPNASDLLLDINNTADLVTAINSAEAIVTTLPWDGAREILSQPEVTGALADKNHLECAFPPVLDTAIDGRNMLVHQAIKQVELMVNPFVTFGEPSMQKYKELFNVMFDVMK